MATALGLGSAVPRPPRRTEPRRSHGWCHRRIVITAGPTREKLDPVRYLSNESSGRMGWALAETAQRAGARVTLVAGPTALNIPKGVTVINVVSAREMLAATRKAARGAHAVIGAAAVADWRPLTISRKKLKKTGTGITLRLTRTPDILGTLARERKGPFPRLAGFALESNNIFPYARKKMKEKKLDLVVANTPSALGGLGSHAWILRPGQAAEEFNGSKKILARRILARLLEFVTTHDR
jgi:phosphopantothenoylcysteine decarboxylase/phosphopantothenate--cysteine ligase